MVEPSDEFLTRNLLCRRLGQKPRLTTITTNHRKRQDTQLTYSHSHACLLSAREPVTTCCLALRARQAHYWLESIHVNGLAQLERAKPTWPATRFSQASRLLCKTNQPKIRLLPIVNCINNSELDNKERELLSRDANHCNCNFNGNYNFND